MIRPAGPTNERTRVRLASVLADDRDAPGSRADVLQQNRAADLPVNRRPVAPGTSRVVNIVGPLHLHKGLSRANETMLAVVPPCAAKCRFVRGISVGEATATRTDRKITDLSWACGSGPGPGAASGLVGGGMGQAALVMVTSKPRAWIWRMWLRIFRSVSRRAW